MKTGLENFTAGARPKLAKARLGLLANPTTVDSRFRHAADSLLDSGFKVSALFGPEHGIRGNAQYMDPIGFDTDPKTGVPVYSLYGADEKSLSPTEESLSKLDALVFDIQDVGSRYYTYVWTMILAARACAKLGIRFVVLDRPNPLGGLTIEGGEVQAAYKSFVGLCSVPNRHGMTAGELATMILTGEGLAENLDVVEMEGWSREQYFDDTDAPWVQPSPNMPTLDTALVYPGMCLLEGTNLSEGRGTTRPFELFGAPFIDPTELCRQLHALDLPGVRFREACFTPTFEKFSGKECLGAGIHVTSRKDFLPYATGIAIVKVCHDAWPDAFAWRNDAYEFRDDVPAFDLLAGGAEIRNGIANGDPLDSLLATYSVEEAAFAARRGEWLRYD